MPILYNYDDARAFCKDQGLTFQEDWLPEIDKAFYSMGLTQEQVDRLMREYIWRVKFLFTPRNYTLGQRFCLAYHFLFR